MAIGKPHPRAAFSLLELIIVIALIGLIGSLMVANANAILRGLGDEPIDRSLVKAVREARYQAASLKSTVQLTFDAEANAWRILDANGKELDNRPVAVADTTRLAIQFEQLLPGRGLRPNDGASSVRAESVYFRQDRSSTPFQVNIVEDTARYTLRFDPFSDIVIHDSRNR